MDLIDLDDLTEAQRSTLADLFESPPARGGDRWGHQRGCHAGTIQALARRGLLAFVPGFYPDYGRWEPTALGDASYRAWFASHDAWATQHAAGATLCR